MRRSLLCVLTSSTVAVVLVATTPAEAGAPNYECAIGSYRIGIDQHRRGGLARVDGLVQRMPFVDGNQNGPSLDLVATIGSDKASIQVRGTGSSASMTLSGKTAAGACAFIPEDFALGQVTTSTLVLRSSPKRGATVVAVLPKGSLAWSNGRFDLASKSVVGTDKWTHFRVVLRINGRSTNGGEQLLVHRRRRSKHVVSQASPLSETLTCGGRHAWNLCLRALGMGQEAGLDGRSKLIEGWGRSASVLFLGPPGP